MNEEPSELSSDEDGNPFVSLGDLLSKGRSVAVLATAIEKFKIYTWDRFGRFGEANIEDKALALRYLASYLEWELDVDPQTNFHFKDDPLSRTAGDANPFSQSGWHKDDLPDFDLLESERQLATDSSSPSPVVAGGDVCEVFRAMQHLTADEANFVFVAEDMLEITARGETRRVPLGALDLLDRRAGGINSQGKILLAMAQKVPVIRSDKKAKAISRLREVLKKSLGINDDPFNPYRKGAGWEPRFKVSDKRDAADVRAKREAERRTVSYESLGESGAHFAKSRGTHESFDSEDDEAGEAGEPDEPDEPDQVDEWLKKNDRNAAP